jgi:murein DD-endopeptidase MepM/ murein hydrolase activator NlpD
VSQELASEQPGIEDQSGFSLSSIFSAILWGVAIGLVIFLAVLLVEPRSKVLAMLPTEVANSLSPVATVAVVNEGDVPLPDFQDVGVMSLSRQVNPRTVITYQQRTGVVEYVVEKKDSLFGIANKFKLKPDTILWANVDVLKDDPDLLKPGMKLKIPPVDGVYYKWKEGDTLESVAKEFSAKADDILLYTGNKLDLTNPEIVQDTYVMVPGGKREVQQWVMPMIPRGKAGVLKTVLGSGACDTSTEGAYGTGTFIYPSAETRLSGNDFGTAHMGIDLAIGVGDPVFASDSGVIVFAGTSSGGYGIAIMIDHGNGYQTLYAHLSGLAVHCGQSVYQGNVIGYGGSTGNSTGPHLHFEVRFMGGFINPWYVLP